MGGVMIFHMETTTQNTTTTTTRQGREVEITKTTQIPTWTMDNGYEITKLVNNARYFDGEYTGQFFWAVSEKAQYFPLTADQFAAVLAR